VCIKYSVALGVLNCIADCCSVQKEHVAVIKKCVARGVLQCITDGCSAQKEYVAVIKRKCRGDSCLLQLQSGCVLQCIAVRETCSVSHCLCCSF